MNADIDVAFTQAAHAGWVVWLVGASLLAAVFAMTGMRVASAAQEIPQFSEAYRRTLSSAAWKRRRAWCMRWTFGRDCIAPWWPATDVDHLHYRNLGHEIPLRDIVPLNWRTHHAVTGARRVFGRAIVNVALRIAFTLWLSPYLLVAYILTELVYRQHVL